LRTGTDRAVLFATDTYNDSSLDPLANPISDAEAIAQELETTYGFEVEVVRDPTRAEVFATLERYARIPGAEDDQLFVFFAGHGTFVRSGDVGRGFVIPRDGHAFSRSTWISYENIAAELDAMPAHRVLLVLDVCFGGAFVRQARSGDPYGTASPQDIVRRYGPYRSRLAVTSGAEEYVSDGRPGEHSPFTYHLLGALRGPGGPDGDGLLTFSEIADAVKRVRGPSPLAGDFGRSEPGGSFFLIPRAPEASGDTPIGGE
ncbi:MAG: caspase family protein, partial [Bacteroidota bacterium]